MFYNICETYHLYVLNLFFPFGFPTAPFRVPMRCSHGRVSVWLSHGFLRIVWLSHCVIIAASAIFPIDAGQAVRPFVQQLIRSHGSDDGPGESVLRKRAFDHLYKLPKTETVHGVLLDTLEINGASWGAKLSDLESIRFLFFGGYNVEGSLLVHEKAHSQSRVWKASVCIIHRRSRPSQPAASR